MTDKIKYEHKSVRAVRGTDGLVISKMQRDGWELVEQAHGTLRSTLTFRRPAKQPPWLLIGASAAVLVIVAAVIGVASAVSDGDEAKDGSDKTTAVVGAKPSAAPSTTTATTEPAATEVITSRNNREFAALLKADSCDDANMKFAAGHAGRTIAFNGSIVNMAPHGDYDTRYDFLLGPGDKGPKTTVGPSFKYEDVNVVGLNLTGKKIPAAVGEGDKFRFVAEVGEFNADQCVFFLTPVSTETR